MTEFANLDFTEFANVYIACGVVHLLLVVIPALVLGPLILSVLVSNKKLRDPTSVLFMCITVVCTLGLLCRNIKRVFGKFSNSKNSDSATQQMQ